jgi:uncharacterized membrane protein YdbT with pleckstrin-like domain
MAAIAGARLPAMAHCGNKQEHRPMGSYIESTLGNGERIIRTTHISLWTMSLAIVVGIVTLVIGVGLIVLGYVYFRYKSTELAVTNRRIVVKFGYFSRRTLEISINKIESVQVEQGAIGRLLGYGSLTIAGTGTTHEPLVGIADPIGFRKACMDAQQEFAAPVA